MSGLTLQQRYYGINRALSSYLIDKGISCPIIKYGIDPATLKDRSNPSAGFSYPYLQTFIPNQNPVAFTSLDSGTLTEFDFQVSFFTAPEDEFGNDEDYFLPFVAVINALSDVNLRLLDYYDKGTDSLTTYADLVAPLMISQEFGIKSGQGVPAAFLIAKMRAVCGYAIAPTEEAILSTDLDSAFDPTME